MYICTCTHVYMYMYTCIYVHIYMYICTCTHVYMYVQQYKCTFASSNASSGMSILGKAYIAPCTSLQNTPGILFNFV